MKGEELILSSTDFATGIALAFQVDSVALQALLPKPWQADPPDSGPLRGANLHVVFWNWLRNEDAEGKPKLDSPERYVAFAAPARNPVTGERASLVLHGYRTRTMLPHPYRTHLPARIAIEQSLKSTDPDSVEVSEQWEVHDLTGMPLVVLRIGYRADTQARSRTLSQNGSRIRSAVDPELWRVYETDGLMDVVRSVPERIDRMSRYEFRISVPELQRLFDSHEELVGVVARPAFMRLVFVPAR